jgi:hypothetical protein
MDLHALAPDARRRVIRAVRKGAAVQDPEEAAAAVGLARWVQALPPPEPMLWPRLGFALLLVVPLVVTFSVLGPGFSPTRAATAERGNARVASGGGASPSP